MEDSSIYDPYEQQLYAVFKNYDLNQTGKLDREGLSQLCATLQLEERGIDLINCLLNKSNKQKQLVTFQEFKDALLKLLGDNSHYNNTQELSIITSDESKSFVNDEKILSDNDDNESPEREISPKYIFGSKKYGRRSRPRQLADSLFEIRNDNEESYSLELTSELKLNKIQRSSSHNDVHPMKKRKANVQLKRCTSFPDAANYSCTWSQSQSEHFTGSPIVEQREIERDMMRELWKHLNVGNNGALNRDELKAVIEYIGVDKIPDKIINELHSKLESNENNELNFNIFLELLHANDVFDDSHNTNQKMSVSNQNESETTFQKSNFSQFISLGPDGSGFINADVIVDIWENAGVSAPQNLLYDLGLTQNQINIADLATVIDDELRNINNQQSSIYINNPHITLLQASLALYQSEIRCLKSAMEHLNAERDKLKYDVNDANERANLLAQEVDDNHAKMERNTKEQVRLLEQRHTDIVRDLTEQMTSEREQASLLTHKLEKKVASLEAEESKLKSQLAQLQQDIVALETENHSLIEQVSELEQTNSQLVLNINVLEGEKQKICDLEGSREREQMLSYLEKISQLQFENTQLKDHNDELCIELESINSQLTSLKLKKCPDLDEINGFNSSNTSAIKRRGETSFSTTVEITSGSDDSPRTGKMRRCHDKILSKELSDGLQIMPFSVSESGLDVDYDGCGDSSITSSDFDTGASSTCGDGATLNDDIQFLKARVNYLEQVLLNYGHDVTSDSNLSKLVADKGLTESLQDRCKQLELILKDIKMGLQTATSDETCTTDYNLNEYVTELQQKLIENVEFIKQISSSSSNGNDTKDSKLMDEQNAEIQRLIVENKKLGQRCNDLELSLDLLRTEYEQCEEYWSNKLDEERQLFDQEQKQSNQNFQDLLNKMNELEEQFSEQDNKLPVIDENSTLEKQFTELEDDFEAYKKSAEEQLNNQQMEVDKLKEIIKNLEKRKEMVNVEVQAVATSVDKAINTESIDTNNSLSSINSTFVWNPKTSSQPNSLDNTSIPIDANIFTAQASPPNSQSNQHQSHSVYRTRKHSASSADVAYRKDEIKRLRNIKTQLDDECQNLHRQKEQLFKDVVELQNKVKEIEEPIITFKWRGMRGFTTSNMNCSKQVCRVSIGTLQELNGRLQQLDQRCRHLQQVLRRNQQQAESMLHQSWIQHKGEINDLQYLLKTTQEKLERQTQLSNEQIERLARTDLLVKDLYIENSYLMATVQRLEHHCHRLTQCNLNNSSSV